MIDQSLKAQLDPVARACRGWRLWRALAGCWAVLVIIGLAAILIRQLTGWSSPIVFFLLIIAGVVASAVVIFRFVNAPLDYRAIAREVETENPGLQALLLTAVEQQPQSPAGELNYLQQRVISEALEHHRRSPWGRRLSQRLLAAQCAHWAGFALLLLVLAGLRPEGSSHGGLWAEAERSNGVDVTPGDASVERGSGLVVLARFKGKLPAEAELVIKPRNENERRIPLAKNLDDPVFGGGIPEVKDDLSYHVEFSHGHTRDFNVKVFDYPRLERADAKLTYPAYTRLPDKTIQDTRRVSAVEGSSLDYSFFLNKPVVTAQFVAKDKNAQADTNSAKNVIPLAKDTNNPSIYRSQFTLDQSHRYELVLVDDAGRTNKIPPEFFLEALKNQPAELKLASPRGDQRVSPLEEVSFQAEALDDFGLRSYGIAYTLAGGETKSVELGRDSGPHEKRQFNYLLPLESLGAQPDQFLSYYVWADDVGPDGQTRRTASDMFFAEIRPFDEIYREGQSPDANANGGGQQGGQTEKLSELQRQITSATWNLKRRESAPSPSQRYKNDASVIHDSQEQALEQARALEEKIDDPRLKGFATDAASQMDKAARHLGEAADKNSVAPLAQALADEQSAAQALLRLQAREYQVARNSRNQRGGGGGGRNQRQLDELDLKQTDNRYETQRQATPAQTPEQREQLQVASRLKELAQRQQDLNSRLKELQTALQEAKTEQEREEVRQRLKRLREEQQDMLADVDELRQRMERPENQSRMADARQQLEQTRNEVQRAAEELNKEAVPQALASGTRAQRELQQLQEDFRRKNSSQFADDMRRMRDNARQLAQNEEDIAKKLQEVAEPKQKTLNDDSTERRDLAEKMSQQKDTLTNLFTEMRQVSEQSETAEPLLSKQLYDTLRQTDQDSLNKSLDASSQLVRRGFVPQASQFEQLAHQNIDELKRNVERAAESVLGDGTEALRVAKRELEDLSKQLNQEAAQAGGPQGTNAIAGGTNGPERGAAQQAQSSGANTNEGPAQASAGQRGSGQESSQSQSGQQANAGGNQQPGNGQGESSQGGGQQQASSSGQNSQDSQNQSGRSGQGGQQQTASANSQSVGGGGGANRNGEPRSTETAVNQPSSSQGGALRAGGGGRRNFMDDNGGFNNGGGGGGTWGPLIGEDYVNWSDRLRNVEEMIDVPDLSAEVARIRDRARAVRLDYKRLGKKPDWAVVRSQIVTPLAEVRSRVDEELMRRESKDALVPIDRDPVPAKFSELVRRYYEQLGKSD